MAKDFHESYEHEIPDMPSDRGTGLVFAGVSAIIGLIIFYASDYTNLFGLLIALLIASLFTFVSLLVPEILRPLNIVWFKFSLLLFKIVNPIIMFLMFITAIIPGGLIMQLFADPLRRKKPEDVESYWIEKDEDESHRPMQNQF